MVTDLFVSFRVVVLTLARVVGLSEKEAVKFTDLLFAQDIAKIDVDLVLELLEKASNADLEEVK